MKTKLRFTRGEISAAMVLLAIVVASNIYYFFVDLHPRPSVDLKNYGPRFEKFISMQRRFEDSVAATKSNAVWKADTIPKFTKIEKKQLYDIVKIDINSCDTNDLKTVPQFGSKRAVKLLEYRDRLGGFYSLSQFTEVYILQNIDTVKLRKYLIVSDKSIKKININNVTYKELVSHPYFDSYLAKLVINHRESKGEIKDMEDFQRITHAYPELIERLRHYLCF